MKKLTITLLSLIMLLFAACGGNTEETETAVSAPLSTSVPAESTEAPTVEPVAEPTAEATAVPEPTDEPSEMAVSADLPRFEPVDDCFVEPPDDFDLEFDLECGYVVVPEFYHGESSRELKLGIIRIKSSDGAENSPLFMLAGGPGASYFDPLTFSLFTPEVFGGVLDARDIILIEERGNKYTDTYLNCPEFFSAAWTAYEQGLDDEGGIALEEEVLQSCIDDFEAQGINFDAYNSGENAADVNAVRQALGYDQIVYYGSSYGSQLGQHVMRDFPDILEAVVLDGANSLSRKSWVEERALDAQWGIDNLIELCAADEKCAETYDIPALLDSALALFDDGPINYTYVDPNDSTVTVDVEVTKSDLANTIHKTQDNPFTVFGLPQILELLTQGGVDTMGELLGEEKATKLLAARDPVDGGLTVLMHFAMVCSDDHVNSVDDVITEGVGEYARLFGQAQAPGYVHACSIIDVAEMPDSTDIDVTLDVPTLLLAGGLDIDTPAFRSQIVADALPNATLLTFPGQGHVQISSATHICAGQIATQFILDPTTSLDTSCLEDFQVPAFVLPDGSMSHE
jgi:pimeloyl-ACP methyl ester carboxylesterase